MLLNTCLPQPSFTEPQLCVQLVVISTPLLFQSSPRNDCQTGFQSFSKCHLEFIPYDSTWSLWLTAFKSRLSLTFHIWPTISNSSDIHACAHKASHKVRPYNRIAMCMYIIIIISTTNAYTTEKHNGHWTLILLMPADEGHHLRIVRHPSVWTFRHSVCPEDTQGKTSQMQWRPEQRMTRKLWCCQVRPLENGTGWPIHAAGTQFSRASQEDHQTLVLVWYQSASLVAEQCQHGLSVSPQCSAAVPLTEMPIWITHTYAHTQFLFKRPSSWSYSRLVHVPKTEPLGLFLLVGVLTPGVPNAQKSRKDTESEFWYAWCPKDIEKWIVWRHSMPKNCNLGILTN